MPVYDIAFSLNREISIEADSYEKAEGYLAQLLKEEGVNLEEYTLEIFDVNEEEES